MSEETNINKKTQDTFSKKTVLPAIGTAIGIAVICFTLVAILPPPEGPLSKDPLRSLLAGLGVFGIACPLCIVGFVLKKRSRPSPYFEGAFIATVLSVFGFLCFVVGLVCVALGISASLSRTVITSCCVRRPR